MAFGHRTASQNVYANPSIENAMTDNDLNAPYYSKGEPTVNYEQNSDNIMEYKSSNDTNSGLKNKLLSKISEENSSNEMSTQKSLKSARNSVNKDFNYLTSNIKGSF